MRKLRFEAGGVGLPVRLDLFLRGEVVGFSRSEVQRLIRLGAVSVNGLVVSSASALVRVGDCVEFEVPDRSDRVESGDVVPVAQDVDFGVVYEDEHVVVVDKPAGLSVHAGAGRKDGTLVNGLLWRYPELSELEPMERPGIVHRLDADTSGLMVVARTAESAAALSAAMKAREVDRRYVAMVLGKLPADAGVIDRPIGRHPTVRTRQAVVEGGRLARTRYAYRSGFSAFGRDFSMLSLRLETGRTHQIRVHLEAIGCPVLGDPVYGVVVPEVPLRRQFLHAERLAFRHPMSGEVVDVSSDLPSDLAGAMEVIGRG